MRYGKAHKEQAKARIVASASARLRQDGIGAIGLRTLVGDAGLTHGAFYSHFDSKSDLVGQAVEEALAQTNRFWREYVTGVVPEHRLTALVSAYLSMRHRDGMDLGCAGAALAPEVARESAEIRRAFMSGIGQIVDLISELLPQGGEPGERLARARGMFASMMGALQISRVAEAAEVEAILSDCVALVLAYGRLPWRVNETEGVPDASAS